MNLYSPYDPTGVHFPLTGTRVPSLSSTQMSVDPNLKSIGIGTW
jgi:hypothetical protein